MRKNLTSITAAIALAFGEYAFAQEQKTSVSTDKPKEVSAQAASTKRNPTPEELEAKFKATLTKATMGGRWCSVKDGQLGPEKEDKYTIQSVTKKPDGGWVINAQIHYNKKDIVAPIPVQVKWAGDTPVIIVDKLSMPGGGTYSARVLVYEHTYAGTWSGGEHAGLLNGVISNDKE